MSKCAIGGGAPAPEPARLAGDPGLPPWLAFWAVAFVAGLPGLWAGWRGGLAALAATADADIAGWLSLAPAALYDLLPPLALLLGLAAACCVPLRAAYVERRYRLGEPPALPALAEIGIWVQARAPRVILRANVLRAGPTAFVYLGYGGRPHLAVFGGLVKLWRADRAAAEAVLAHELAHCRRGDAWLAGVGSPFAALVRWIPAAYLALVLLPLLAGLGVQAAAAAQVYAQAGGGAARFWGAQAARLATATLPALALGAVGQALQLLAPLTLPVAALWAAELNADLLAAGEPGRRDTLRRALRRAGEGRGRWRWLGMLAHPPAAWRAAALAAETARSRMALLALFPLAAAARLALLHGRAALAYLAAGVPAGEWGARMLANTGHWLAAQAGPWTAMALLLAAWPWLAPGWERLCGGRPAAPTAIGGRAWPYLAAAAVTGTVAAVGWIVR